MKKAAEAWLDFAHRDLEAAKLLVDHEYVSMPLFPDLSFRVF